jgi:hypothetical protein
MSAAAETDAVFGAVTFNDDEAGQGRVRVTDGRVQIALFGPDVAPEYVLIMEPAHARNLAGLLTRAAERADNEEES